MADEIELQKLKEEYPDFFGKTPHEIVEFSLSEETAKQITDICEKNGIREEREVEAVAQRVGSVILGKLPSGNLAMTLELGVKLTPEIAKKIANEANQFISSAMVQSKSGEIVQPKKELPKETTIEEPTRNQSVAKDEKPKNPPSKDVYREPVE